jgi:hypothetical protein
MASVFCWALNWAGAEAKIAAPITAKLPDHILAGGSSRVGEPGLSTTPSTSLGLRILTEIPPQSTHMAAMRAYRAEADGCFTSQTNPARAGAGE